MYECDNSKESAKWVFEVGDDDEDAFVSFALAAVEIGDEPDGSRYEISDMSGPIIVSAGYRGQAREYLLTPEAFFELNDSRAYESDDETLNGL